MAKKTVKKKTTRTRHKLATHGAGSTAKECSKALIILEKAHDASTTMLHCFDLLREERGSRRGGTTDNEQAALRAMLIMAAAGLDSVVKQVIRDSLTTLANKDEAVNKSLSKFLKRKLQDNNKMAADILTSILVAEGQREQVVELYIQDLTGSSLQSTDELFAAAAALGIEAHGIDKQKDKEIFHARNQMIHELDIDLSAARRSQNQRGLTQMITWTNRLFAIAKQFIIEVDKKLNE